MTKEVKRLEERIARLESDLALARQEKAIQSEQLALYRKVAESGRDGIALYDADFRLLYCNQNYKDLFKGIADLLTPGRSIAEIARSTATTGLIPEATGDIEKWVRSRSRASSRKFDEPYLVQMADGRWLRFRFSRKCS